MLRPEFVQRKLHLIADDLGLLLEFRSIGRKELVSDPIRLAAVERILERMVLRAIDVNEHLIAAFATGEEERTTRLTYREIFRRLADYGVCSPEFAEEISRSAALRDVLVHDYDDLDHRILHASIETTLEQYQAYVKAVGDFLERSVA